MNKWSFLLLPVLWLAQSAISERIFVDGRVGRFDYPSRSILSNKRLAISEPLCSDTINELRSPSRDVRLSNRYDTLTRSSRLDHRLDHSELFSGDSKRVLTNVPFRFGDSTRYNTDDKTFLRGIEDSKLRTNIRSGPHKIYGGNRADRILDSYNEPNPIRMQRSRERNIKLVQGNIVILRSRNIRDLSRSGLQDITFERSNVRESRTDDRRNNNMDRRLNVNNQRSEVSDEMEIRDRYVVARLERERYINKRSPVSRLNERDESARNSGSRLKVDSYSDQRVQRRRVRVDNLPENRQIGTKEVRFNLNGGSSRYISIQNIERFFDPDTTRQIRDNGLYRLDEEDFVDHLSRNMRDNLRIVENSQFETSDRRTQAIRRAVMERRERDERYRLENENRRVSDVRGIRLSKERHHENMLDENRYTRIILLNNKEKTLSDRVYDEVRERRNDNTRLNRVYFRSIQIDNRNGQRLERDTNKRLMRRETRINGIVVDLRSSSNYKNTHNEDRDILRHTEVERRDKNRSRQLRNIRENREENNRDGIIRQRERSLSNIHNRNQAVRSTRIIPETSVERIELRLLALPEREINNNQERIKERLGKENRLSRLRITKGITENDVVGATTREIRYDNHASKNTKRNNNSNTRSRNVGEGLASRDHRSFNTRKYDVENENRIRNRHLRTDMHVLQRSRSDERILSQLYTRRIFKRMAEVRTRTIDEMSLARTNNINDYFRLNKRASVEIRAVEMPNIREFKTVEKRDDGHRILRDSNSVMEMRADRLKFELRDRRSRITEQNKVLIRYKEITSGISANRNSESQRGIVNEYRMQLTRNEDNNNRRMRERREVRSINDKSDTRDSRHEVTMRPLITVDLSIKSKRDLQTRRVTRDINEIAEKRIMHSVRLNEGKSKNTLRDLQESVSDRRREASRESKSYTSNRDLMTRVQDERLGRSRNMRLISNSRSERHYRSLSRSQTNEREDGMRVAIIRTGYEVFKNKNQSENQIFIMKWQYVFYLIQGVYILSVFTKQKNFSHGMKSRFANCFLPFPTSKLD